MARVIHLRNWNRSDPNQVYIGRAGKGLKGTFGNPVVVGKLCPVCRSVHSTAGSTLQCYEADLVARMVRDPGFQTQVVGLRDKTLVCFCAPGPCHGDVLARMSDEVCTAGPVHVEDVGVPA